MHAHMYMCRDTHPCTCRKVGGVGWGEIFFCCSLSYFYSLGISLFMDLELTFFLLCRLVASSKLFDPLSLTPLVLEIQMCTDVPAMCTTKCLAAVGSKLRSSCFYAGALTQHFRSSSLTTSFYKDLGLHSVHLDPLRPHFHEFIPSALFLVSQPQEHHYLCGVRDHPHLSDSDI